MAKITRIKASDGPREDESGSGRGKTSRSAAKQGKAAKSENSKLNKKVVQSQSSDRSKKDGATGKAPAKKNDAAEKAPAKKQGEETKKSGKVAKTDKKPFVLWRPFVALGHYLKGSWYELRQVRWPNRKTTWKMFFAVIVYSLIFVVIISVLDLIFSGLSNLILNR